MKLNIDGCREYIKRNCISNYSELSEELGVEVSVLHLWEAGGKMGYDAVRDIYNRLGEKVTREIIDFEEETLDGFKGKYVLVGKTLY